MKIMEHYAFLAGVQEYVTAHPDVAAYINDYVAAGLERKLSQAYERAADMEVALVAATTKRYKGADKLILSKLEKWQGKTSLNWNGLIEELKQK